MDRRTEKHMARTPDPYRIECRPEPHNPVARVGMSLVEMVFWLVVMAVLAIGMIALLWNVSK